jgi:hypothetical protein
MLADLDRPVETYRYEPWNRDVTLRALSASQFVEVMNHMSKASEDDTATKIIVMSAVCSYGVVDPCSPAEEWSSGVCVETLMHLGNKVLAMSSKQLVEGAKKN